MKRTAIFCALLLIACSEDDGSPADDADDGLDGDTSSDTAPSSVVAIGELLEFTPSNIDPLLEFSAALPTVRFEGSECALAASINTDDCSARCVTLPDATCRIVPLTDGSDAAVLVTGSVFIASDVQVDIVGERPLILVAAEEIRIDGRLRGLDVISNDIGVAGGYSARAGTGAGDGRGPGGGEGSPGESGSGGGAHCGRGGDGGRKADDTWGNGPGGEPYGSAELVPLTTGSAGGSNGPSSGGAGGGAVQLIAGVRIAVGGQGVISMPGNGGNANRANGGGAGGAVLLEAPYVVISGAIIANGGGGGAGELHGDGLPGQDGTGNDNGGRADNGDYAANGGNGGTAELPDGRPGADLNAEAGGSAGGGGGGAGWIRINTLADGNLIDGMVSPGFSSGCASTGVLQFPPVSD